VFFFKDDDIMYKDRWKTRIDAGRRRKPDNVVKKYGTAENIIKGIGVAALLGVLGLYARHIPYQAWISKFKAKPQEPEITLFSL